MRSTFNPRELDSLSYSVEIKSYYSQHFPSVVRYQEAQDYRTAANLLAKMIVSNVERKDIALIKQVMRDNFSAFFSLRRHMGPAITAYGIMARMLLALGDPVLFSRLSHSFFTFVMKKRAAY